MTIPKPYADFVDGNSNRPVIVVCGAHQFSAEKKEVSEKLTAAGWDVINIDNESKLPTDLLDEYINAIDLAAMVYIVNKDKTVDPIGMYAIVYARACHKPVCYMENDDETIYFY